MRTNILCILARSGLSGPAVEDARDRVLLATDSFLYGAQPSGMAQPILSPDDAARPEDRQGCHGSPTGCLSVLDDAAGMGLPSAIPPGTNKFANLPAAFASKRSRINFRKGGGPVEELPARRGDNVGGLSRRRLRLSEIRPSGSTS